MPEERSDYRTTRAGDRLVLAGTVLFAIGALGTVLTIMPMILLLDPMPTVVYLAAMLAPVGLGLALAGMVRDARARRGSRPQVTVGAQRRD